MEKTYLFGPTMVLFRDLPHYPNWPFWNWKLDSFQTMDGTPDIIVDYSPNAVMPIGAPVWTDKAAGREIYLHEDGTLVWQQTDSKCGQLLLQFTVSRDWNAITLRADNSSTVGMGAFESLTFLIYYAFLHRQVLTFHGALVEEGGRGKP